MSSGHPIQGWLGRTVTVVVDRPAGMVRHGDGWTITYPINYGYVPDAMGGDGEFQDAYIFGVAEPLTEFTGEVIAVCHRRDDVEDKLVVAPVGMRPSKERIETAIAFMEQWFDSWLECLE